MPDELKIANVLADCPASDIMKESANVTHRHSDFISKFFIFITVGTTKIAILCCFDDYINAFSHSVGRSYEMTSFRTNAIEVGAPVDT
jgi:hypothetical protein